MRIPIFFEGNVTVDEIASIFHNAGYMVKTEGGVLVARRVPQFLRQDAQPAKNVVRMPGLARRAK